MSRLAARALAIAAVTLAIQNGVVMAFAVIYLPLITEFGGSRAEVAMVQSAVFLVGGISGPLIGWAFDRLGPRLLLRRAHSSPRRPSRWPVGSTRSWRSSPSTG